MTASHRAAGPCQALVKQPCGLCRQFRHKPCGARENCDLRALSGRIQPSLRQRKRQLAAGGATTDHCEPFGMAHGRQRRKAVAKIADRLDRNAMGIGARNGPDIRFAADIDRQHIKGNRRASPDAQQICIGIETGNGRMDETRARHAGKPGQVDMDVVRLPYAFDISRQHAGIGGVDVTRDKRGPQAFDGPHRQ